MRLAFLSIGRHIHTERWIRWFADRGDECHLLTVQPGSVAGVEVHDIRAGVGPKPFRYAFSLGVVKRLLKTIQPDLLNTHFLTGYGYWGHFSGVHPNVLTVWGDDVYVTPFESSLKNWLAKRALKSCDALTGDSVDILEVAESMGARPERSYRILWGVDFEVFRERDTSVWRQEHDFAERDMLYFSPRSYSQPYYNIDVIIAAAARVREQQPNARFLFSGYEGDPAPFSERVREAGIEDVTKVIGRIPHREFALALSAADVVISVPSVDATAVSLLESMACATATIVSDLPSSTEWVRHNETGLVVPPRNVEALAGAMVRLGADSKLRQRLGRAAMGIAHRNAGFTANMGYVASIFDHLVHGSGQGPEAVSLSALRGAAR